MIKKKIKFEYEDNFSILSIAVAVTAVIFIGVFAVIEGFCSAYGIEYDKIRVFMTALTASAICGCFSSVLNAKYKIFMYIIAFAEIIFVALNITDVIKSALLSMANQAYPVISNKYLLPAVDGFDEIMPRDFTVNAVLILGGVFLAVLFAFFICELKNIFIPALIVLVFYVIDIYFDAVPSSFAVFAMIAFIFLGGITAKNRAKTGIFINLFIGVVLTFCMVFGKNIYNISDFKLPKEANVIKQATDVFVRDIMIKKFSEYKKYQISTSISGGMLSSYGSVSMSEDTAVTVEIEKYTDEPVFIKAFNGTVYQNNQWTESDKVDITKGWQSITAEGMRDLKPEKMKIVSQSMEYVYLPYYSDLEGNDKIEILSDDKVVMTDKQPEIVFYPYDKAYIDDDAYYEQVKKKYLQLPDVNKETIKNLSAELELTDDIETIQDKLKGYFESFTFTRNPGLIPWQTDFVNYFINESKRGHVAHFATTAVLVYRNMGIPSRYAEGYVFKIDESGTTKIPKKNAYAWAEVYLKNFGWIPVDVTPDKFKDENYDDDLSYGDENSEITSESLIQSESETAESETWDFEDIEKTKHSKSYVIFIVLGIIAVGAYALVVKLMFFGNNYNRNVRNIIGHFKNKRYCKKAVSYRECAEIMAKRKKLDRENVIKAFEIFESMAFGGKELSKEDYLFVVKALSEKKK